MTIQAGFTLCFLLHEDDVLMLHRKFPPNKGLWNGVGGHILPGETPRGAVIREVAEETGYEISDPVFGGLLTWEGFEIPPGGIAIFTAWVSHRDFISNHEGELAWQKRDFACTSPEVVDNIHVFLPKILSGGTPLHFHFTYENDERIHDRIIDLPADFSPDQPYTPREALIEEARGDFLISSDKGRLQVEVIEALLSEQTYWAQGRTREVIEQTIQKSTCLGLYHDGQQVGFARLVTDESTFAWLCDVIVDEAFRGQSLGKWLVETVCRMVDGMGIQQTLLATRDAQDLYERYGGFMPLHDPTKWMNRFYHGKD